MGINWWQSFLQTWLSGIAAILTVTASIYGGWKWIRRLWEKKFLAKPFDVIAKTNFTYNDVLAGVEKLMEPARIFEPVAIVGINRGGAIFGGILGKELGLIPRIITIDEKNQDVWFNDADELRGRKVLLVDDRFTDGKHMDLAYDHLKRY
ncbi:phosphoribosyltransferase family protein, partial [Acidobacteriota bacterium]